MCDGDRGLEIRGDPHDKDEESEENTGGIRSNNNWINRDNNSHCWNEDESFSTILQIIKRSSVSTVKWSTDRENDDDDDDDDEEGGINGEEEYIGLLDKEFDCSAFHFSRKETIQNTSYSKEEDDEDDEEEEEGNGFWIISFTNLIHWE